MGKLATCVDLPNHDSREERECSDSRQNVRRWTKCADYGNALNTVFNYDT